MKKALIVASVISFIEWFNKENIEFLRIQMDCEVHIAVNAEYFEDTDETRTRDYLEKIHSEGVVVHKIKFARSPLSSENIQAYRKLKALIDQNHFDLIHCHTPAASMLARLAARKSSKQGTVVMYTCHGFHFHNASPKKNWLLYYPIEKWLSRYCDYLVTINREDFNRAKTFYCPNVRYIPSVGVDLTRIRNTTIDMDKYKTSLGIPADAILLLSIGEMIQRKNHEVIIRAVAKIKDEQPKLYYAIAGKGPQKEHLDSLATDLGISDRVKFLGFRKDIPELCHAANISAFPSKIEGLGLAGVEAMAAGVPLVSSNVHGILDYVKDGVTGYAVSPDDVDGFAEAISKLAGSVEQRERMKEACIKATEPFDLPNALKTMWDIYREALN